MTFRLIWPEVGKLDSSVVNIVLDEVMRASVDGGLGSTRCETMAEIVAHMCSKSARGRILAKLRKVVSILLTFAYRHILTMSCRPWGKRLRSLARHSIGMFIGTRLLPILGLLLGLDKLQITPFRFSFWFLKFFTL